MWLDWLRVECPGKEEGRIQKAKAVVIFTVQSNRDGRVVKSLERRAPHGRQNAWSCRANCFQHPGGDLSRPANPQARLSALRVIARLLHAAEVMKIDSLSLVKQAGSV
jgi:hypothetical protein